jgi:hypothetical protein
MAVKKEKRNTAATRAPPPQSQTTVHPARFNTAGILALKTTRLLTLPIPWAVVREV